MTDTERGEVAEWIRDLGYSWGDSGRLGSFFVFCILVGLLAGGVAGFLLGGTVGLALDILNLRQPAWLGAHIGMVAGGLTVIAWLIHGLYPGSKLMLTRDLPQRAVLREKLKNSLVEERHYTIYAAVRINEEHSEPVDITFSGYILQVGENLLLSLTDFAQGEEFERKPDTPFPGREITLVYLPGEPRILGWSWSGDPVPLSRVKRLDPEKERSLEDFKFMEGRIEELDKILLDV